jgi:hypothetical protein
MLRDRQRHDAATALVSIHAKRGPSDGKPSALPLSTARLPPR